LPERGGGIGAGELNERAGGAVAQVTELSCGAACGEMLTGIPQSVLMRLAGAPTHVEALARALGQGWNGAPVAASSLNALVARGPFVAQLYERGMMLAHMVVVQGMQSGLLSIRDPWNGGSTYQMTAQEFMRVWTQYVVWK
jgi:Papain-like cysteine protease AvrRpt2